MFNRSTRLLLTLLAVLHAPASWAVYKCTDAAGRTVYQQTPCQVEAEEQSLRIAPAPTSTTPDGWNCDGRSICAQMTSCAEATFFYQQCGVTGLDRDNDGLPCEDSPCDLGRAAPLSVRPSEAAAIEQVWRNDARAEEARQEVRDRQADAHDERQARCAQARAEIDRLMGIYRDSRDIDEKRRANRQARDLQQYVREGCPG